MTRRQLLSVTASAGAAVVVAACGAVPAAPAEAPKEAAKPAATPVAKAEAKEVQYWSHPTLGFQDGAVGAGFIALFQEKNPALRVKAIPTSYGDTINKLPAAVAGGAAPDLSYIDRFVPKTYAATGVVANITDWVKGSKVMDPKDVWERILNDVTYKGRYFGWPWAPDSTTLFLNNDALLEVGLDPAKPPATWDDMQSAVNKLFKKSGAEIARLAFAPGFGSEGNAGGWQVPYWQQGGELLSADETKSTINNEKAVRAFEYTLRLYEAQGGYDAIGAWVKAGQANPRDLLPLGKLAMLMEKYYTPIQKEHKEKWDKIKFTLSTMPIPPGGQNATSGAGWAHIIPTGAKNGEAAFAFLEFLFDKPQDLRYADVAEHMAVRKSVANSNDFIKNNPIRQHAVKEMAGARWVVTAPGGLQILGVHDGELPLNIWQKKKTIPEALAEAEAKCQKFLDEAEAKSVVK